MILGVNIDHVATLREARRGREPDPLMAAPLAILGGADGITVHLREDRRHIRDRDLALLREVVAVELNLEMAATAEMVRIARKTKPDMVTLVPERRQELTTEGGLAVMRGRRKLADAVKHLHDGGLPVSLFIDPDKRTVEGAAAVGADMVELHTGTYADAPARRKEAELRKLHDAAAAVREAGLKLNAGHGLNYHNVLPVAQMEGLRGLYIGHSIISRAVFVGLEMAVREMKSLVESV